MKRLPLLPIILALTFAMAGFAQESEHSVTNKEVNIAGTLLEANTNEYPLVIFLTGSGGQDRDETIFGFKPFKIIAEHFAEQGISSFRFDDRQMGKSTGNLSEATLTDLAGDVQAIMDYFGEDYQSYILLGHSQGGMTAAAIARADERVSGLMLWATPTVPLKDVITDQIRIIQFAMGKTETDIQNTLEFQEMAYEAARTNEGWDGLRNAFKSLVETEIAKLPPAQQAYVTDVEAFANAQFEAQVKPIQSPHMRSYLHYDAMQDVIASEVPSIALFGGKDTQVTDALNGSAYKAACEANNLPCTYKLYPEANHLFQKAGTGLADEYASLPKEFVDGFLADLAEWIKVGLK
jgi:hypothetical protein